jgi:glycosyltransferase involved in cell wall biosynthesis
MESLQIFFDSMSRKEHWKAFGIPENARVAIFVGNFRPYHNLELLVRSVGKIAQQIPEFLLVLVGDSIGQGGLEHRPTIEDLNSIAREERVHSRIRFVGRKAQHVVALYVNAAELGVSLTDRPGIFPPNVASSIKNAEYMACGIPIICTRAAEVASCFERNRAGIVVELEMNQVADAIVQLLLNDPIREEMGRRALKIVEERYSWQMKSKETAMLLGELVQPEYD